MNKLHRRVAIVTGGARGIGRSICLALAGEGATVAVNFLHSEPAAQQLIAEIQNAGGDAFAIRADVTDIDQVEAMAETVFQRVGRIDVLVNNAGIIRDRLLMDMDERDWRIVMEVNVGGAFHCSRAVAKYMVLQRAGRIINLSSIAAGRGGKGQSNYAASKGAIDALTRSLAVELAPKGICVNAVAPGMIDTEMSEKVRRAHGEHLLAAIPLQRWGKPEEVARVVAFLASDDASYITGEIIHVTGGMGVCI